MKLARLVPEAILIVSASVFSALAGCAEGGTVGATFQDLGGSGGNGTGGSAQGGSGGTGGSTGGATTSSTTTSTTATTSTTDTTTTTSTTGPTCVDSGAEPNENEATAKNLGTIDDCDGSGESVSGVLNGPDDQDWYRYDGQDGFGCSVDPTREVMFMAPARICKFVECDGGGAPSFSCPAGTTGATSPANRPGCCGTDGFSMEIDCPGIDDHATVYIRIDNPNEGDCIPYTVNYHF